ncbi:MAG: endonuclease III [Lachnospiraceae bacterium]|nr:endonuclease III [Lachnospiraceae bacterium]
MDLDKKSRIKEILKRLDNEYGSDVRVYLNHDNAWQLLIATILSAQCTDDRVNKVTVHLFKKYPDLESFANAEQKEMEKDIHSTGFYTNKAKNIIGAAKMLIEEYDGEVPKDIDELTRLPGVGRKTANVVRGNIYDIPSIVVDTHVKRLSNRLGLTKNTDPVKIEFDLMKCIPKDHWIAINIQLIALGRTICTARSPKCEECFLGDVCPYFKKR